MNDFAGLSLDEQLQVLERGVEQGKARELLELTRDLRDGAPLTWLVGRLGQTEWFEQEREWFAFFLKTLSDTAIQACLKGAIGSREVARTVDLALEEIPTERLPAFCLLDRFLKHNAPDLRDGRLKKLVERCLEQVRRGDVPDEASLVRLPSRALRALNQAAQDPQALLQARQDLARKVIAILADSPKGVSQANAEELLSRRVYTDPGHFLIELLQNADDAEARTFEVRFEPERIVVWHDGLPFDARDLVGVTSIGQTTKRKQQIGFFGVGFKSVYEVSDRPQIYSDVYRFEIADISIPRYLNRRPQDIPPDGTCLVLPLRHPNDPERNPETLYRRALKLDPCVLLTLRELRAIGFWLGQQSHRMERFDQQDLSAIQVGERKRVFSLESGTYRYEGAREASRPDSTEITVGVLLQAPDQPAPFPSGAATVYSYLPTEEYTGLRFFIQGHFDVPVDRERIAHESEWNRWILERVPELVKAQVERYGAGMLDVLPLAEEMASPLFEALPSRIYQQLKDLPFLPAQDGQTYSPQQIRLASEEVVELFQSQGPPLLQTTQERHRRLAEAMEIRPFTIDDLVDHLGNLPLTEPEDWLPLYDLLLEELEKRERRLEFHDAAELERRLQARLTVCDAEGETASVREVYQAEGLLQELYRGHRPLVSSKLVQDQRAKSLLTRLGMRELGGDDLLKDLAEDPSRFLQDTLYDYLAEAPWSVAEQAAALPIFPARDGFRHLARTFFDQEGLFVATPPAVAELLPERHFLTRSHPLFDLLRPLEWTVSRLLVEEAPDDRVLDLLLAEECELTAAALGRLLEREREGRPLRSLFRPAEPALRRLLGEDRFLDPESLIGKVAEKFDLLAYLPEAGPEAVLQALERGELEHSQAVAYLCDRVQELSQEQLERLLQLPLAEGRRLGNWEHRRGDECFLAEAGVRELLEALRVPLLPPELEQSLGPLLEAAGWKPIGLEQAVPLLAGTTRDVQSLLVPHKEAMVARFPLSYLSTLPLWWNQKGDRVAANQLAQEPALAEKLGAQEAAAQPDQPLGSLLGELDTLESEAFLETWLERHLREGEPLEVQPEPLSCLTRVESLKELLKRPLQVDVDGRLRRRELKVVAPAAERLVGDTVLRSEMLHLEWPDQSGPRLEPERILAVLPDHRQRFYDWLLACQADIFTSPEACRILSDEPLFLSSGGRRLAARELVLDPDFPELEIDWRPHPEIPVPVLELLRRHLGIGQPEPAEIVSSHLLPAYRKRLETGEEGPVLDYLVKLLAHQSTEAVRGLLGELRLRDCQGQPRSLDQLLLPAPGCEPLKGVPAPAQAERRREFLEKLGVATLPDSTMLARLAAHPGRQFFQSLEIWLRHDFDFGWLRENAWLPDGNDKLRYPSELLLPTGATESLAGTFADLYPHPRLEAPHQVLERLGLKGVESVDFQDVVRHLIDRVEHQKSAPLRLFRFLEEGLERDTIPACDLKNLLSGYPFIRCDDRIYRHPDKVFTLPVFRWFGDRRGAWEAGEDFPRLGALFGLRPEVTAPDVVEFLGELAQESDVLDSDPAMPRMLRACYLLLEQSGQTVDREWPVLLAVRARTRELVLRRAATPGFVRSDTPTLEELFGQVGELYLADRGEGHETLQLDRFYRSLRIPRLRDAYRVEADLSSGRDITDQVEIGSFRRLLKALYSVVPRVKLQRGQLVEEGWLFEQRLKPLTAGGTIRVIEGLKVRYSLAGVGAASRLASAAYDPQLGSLLLESEVVKLPGQFATSLANALVSCIYEGPGQEQLMDILELLLPLGEEARMQAYLDRRHFPRLARAPQGPAERALNRVGELLDYRLHHRLSQVYPELAEVDWESWQGDSLKDELEGVLGQSASWEEKAARHLLARLGVEAQPELTHSLTEFFRGNPLRLPQPEEPEPVESDLATPSQESEPPPEPEEPRRSALWDRLMAWVPSSLKPEAEPVEVRLPSNGLAPVEGVAAQLDFSRQLLQLYLKEPSESRLSYEPRRLPSPHVYALATVGATFDPATQGWLPELLAAGMPFHSTGQKVTFKGRLLPGKSLLPQPLYSRMLGKPRVFGRAGSVSLSGPDRLGQWQIEVRGEQPVGLRYQVELGDVPLLEGVPELRASERLVQPTVALQSLPNRVVSWLNQATGSAWEKALAAKQFVRDHYLYDESYREHPATLRSSRRLREGSGNHHLELLHASADEVYLGRGICYELNVLVCELLRHLEVPAVVATCWVLDQGYLDRPDHLICLALVNSASGPCLLPLDATSDRTGPRHLLGQAPEESAWGGGLGSERQRLEQELTVLARAFRKVFGVSSLPPEGPSRARELLVERLGSDSLLHLFLACLRGDYQQVSALPAGLTDLVEQGWVRVAETRSFSVLVDEEG